MKKILLPLITLSLLSCSSEDTLEDVNIQNNEIQTKNDLLQRGGGGFVNTPTDPQNKVWQIIDYPWQIYGFYSSFLNKHMYSSSGHPSMIPKTQPGQSWYFLDRALGATDGEGNGNGSMISSWFNTNTQDLVLTTNPNEFTGQNGWEKVNDLGKSFIGNEPGTFPIYRYFRNETKSHFYTRDKNELGDGKNGFVYEGIAFYLKEPAPYEYRIHDGTFYQDKKTNSVYVVMEGQLRMIENTEVLTRVFDFRNKRPLNMPATYINKIDDIEIIQGSRGPMIQANARLSEDVNTGMRYFSDPNGTRGNLKIIPSMLFDIYHFNDGSLVRTTGTNNSRLQELKKTY
ncbi:hypothetical protein [Chryseobacterium carnipullorum]|uniref:hypothetical protein n=1 Tax=Chryseobacterium carnipullorum TaxID=1124835 RepID=UPI000E8ED3A5|nr:hypothetical protein [Chryseobacterium carnipullorum]HBV17774.1 hypothetical protein [Chryseobacterium carnipullorum]